MAAKARAAQEDLAARLTAIEAQLGAAAAKTKKASKKTAKSASAKGAAKNA
jgi:BMFP domain-containing protein YqiC